MSFLEQLFSEEFIYALGWTVVHSLWQGILVAATLAFLLHRFRKHSAKLRYELATFALFSMLIFGLVSFLYLFEAAQQPLVETFQQILSPTAVEVNQHTILESSVALSINFFNTHLPLFVSFWFLGALFFLVRLLAAYAYIQKIKQHPHYPIASYWEGKFQNLLCKTPIKRSIQLAESAIVQTPMVIGFFKPAILMPLGALNHLTPEEVEAILAHELAHIFRNDYLVNIIQSLIEILFYFNPAVWWISAQVRIERENCCDDIAVQLCGSSLTYAKALVKLQEINQSVPRLAMPLSNNKEHLLNRIKRILNQPQNKSNVMEKITASGLLLIAVLFLSLNSGKAFQPKDTTTTTTDQEAPISTPEHIISPTEMTTAFEALADMVEKKEITTDSIIPKIEEKKMTLRHNSNGNDIQVSMEEGEIQTLEINGETIPEEDFSAYESVINDLMNSVPPPPPPPPAPPVLKNFKTPPAPPAPPTSDMFPAPKAPPAPPKLPSFLSHNKRIKVLKEDESGNQIIMVEGSDLEEPIKIKIQADEIYINGEKIEEGGEFKLEEGNSFNFDDRKIGKVFFQKELNPFRIIEGKDELPGFKHSLLKLKGDLEHEEQLVEILKEQEFSLEKSQEKLAELQGHLAERQFEIIEADPNNRFLNQIGLFSKKGNSSDKINRFFSALEKQLLADGLIESLKRYRFKLTDRKMKVNGKKQDADLRNKYIRLYQRLVDTKVGNRFEVEITKKGDKIKSSISR
ncbi:MAG: M56 family metallopeptidase [Saprospiraceae bacterium]